MASYTSRFTPNGHSIAALKKRASALKAQHGCTHSQALNEVARAIGYSDWQAVASEEADEVRDEFFSESLQLKDRNRPDYEKFLAEHRLQDSPDAFRQFLVADYAWFKALGFDQYRLGAPGDADELLQHLGRLAAKGAETLLPQNLDDVSLERLVGHTRLAFAHMQHTSGLQLPPTNHLGPIAICVLSIACHLRQQRHPHAEEFKIKLKEIYDATRNYRVRLELEFLSRRTRVKFEHATLANVLLATESVSVQVEPISED